MDLTNSIITRLKELFISEALTDVYSAFIYGSVARNDNISGISDIDIMVLLTTEKLSYSTATSLHNIIKVVSEEHPTEQVIIKIYSSDEWKSKSAPYLNSAVSVESYASQILLYGEDMKQYLRDKAKEWPLTKVYVDSGKWLKNKRYQLRAELVSATNNFPLAKNQFPGCKYENPQLIRDLRIADLVLDVVSHLNVLQGRMDFKHANSINNFEILFPNENQSLPKECLRIREQKAIAKTDLFKPALEFVERSIGIHRELEKSNLLREALDNHHKGKLPYRNNACGIIQDQHKRFLIIKDAGSLDWKFFQGGVEKDESFEETIKRELKEELGITEFTIKGRATATHQFDWPKPLQQKTGFQGQVLHVFVITIDSDSKLILQSKEVLDTKWIEEQELKNALEEHRLIPFKIVIKEQLL